jgi:hypothetical protein
MREIKQLREVHAVQNKSAFSTLRSLQIKKRLPQSPFIAEKSKVVSNGAPPSFDTFRCHRFIVRWTSRRSFGRPYAAPIGPYSGDCCPSDTVSP